MGYEYWKYARRIDATAMSLHIPSNARILRIYTLAGVTTIYGEATTPPNIQLYDDDALRLNQGGTAASILLDDDIALTPKAASYVKFGSYVATGDVACNGYIAIKDAAGNPRKLMTTA